MKRLGLVALAAALVLLGGRVAGAATLSFTPTDDATLRESRPDGNYGANAAIEVDRSSRKDGLLRFEVSGSDGRAVVSAQLRLFVTDASPVGGDVFVASHSSWDETTVTWSTAPATQGARVASIGPVSANAWVTVDVSSAILGDGPVTFRITSDSANGADYATLQAPGGQVPELVVEFGASAPTDTTPPTVPRGLSGEAQSPTLVHLSWAASSDGTGVASYDVVRDGQVIATTPAVTSFDDNTVTADTTYVYAVRARDFAGNTSDPSDPVGVTTPIDSAGPATPLNVTATAMCTFRTVSACYANAPVEVEVRWAPPASTGGVVGYDIYRDGLLLASVDELTTVYEDFSAVPETTYVYAVRSRTASGAQSDDGGPAWATTAGPEQEPPSAPTGLTASPEVGGVALSWQEAADNTVVTAYDVFRDGALIAASATTSFLDVAATPGAATEYRVRARDAFGNASTPSAPATVPSFDATPSLEFTPEADATLRESSPTGNYGGSTSLEVDQSSRKDALLRFDLSGLAGREVARATLRLFVLDQSPVGGDIAIAEASAWSESTVTWATAPASLTPVGSIGGVVAGTWVERDVTSAVAGDGLLTFRIASTSANGADYASREDDAGRAPTLVVDFELPEETGQPTFPISAAFYYPWYPETWTVNGAHVSYEPLLGYYSTVDTAVQQAHIDAMSEAGLDAAISSWWGIGHWTDVRLDQLLGRTLSSGASLKWAVYYEGENIGDPSVAAITQDLQHLAQLAASSAYLRVDGRFVVFVYADGADGCGMVDRWTQANAAIGGQAYVVLKTFSGRDQCSNQPDSWHQYAPAQAEAQVVGFSFAVSPGFWRADQGSAVLARDLDRWTQNIANMVASGAPWQLVTTFNEWGEGTAVEAETGWGTAYLDALRAALAPGSPGGGETAIVLAGAGDIGHPGLASQATAQLIEGIRPDLVFTTGDNAYPVGAIEDFLTNYEPTWGRFKALTRPAAGNHEYLVPDASGYFSYFGALAGAPGAGWYVYDVGNWRVYVLNSNCDFVGGCGADSPQYAWLAADLAANPRDCSLAYWHHPRFASGVKDDDPQLQPFWALLESAGVELVMAGHDHNYQRYAPQDDSGRLDQSGGMVEIVVGTGGSTSAVDPTGTNRLAAADSTLGVLKLGLLDHSFDWEFVPVTNGGFTDRGSRACH